MQGKTIRKYTKYIQIYATLVFTLIDVCWFVLSYNLENNFDSTEEESLKISINKTE